MCAEKSFLRYLIENCEENATIGHWRDIKEIEEELKYAEENPLEFSDEEMAELKAELSYSKSVVMANFEDYKESVKDGEIGSLEEEIQKVIDWHEEMHKVIDINDMKPQEESESLDEYDEEI